MNYIDDVFHISDILMIMYPHQNDPIYNQNKMNVNKESKQTNYLFNKSKKKIYSLVGDQHNNSDIIHM